MSNKTLGLRQQILSAPSEESIVALLTTGKTFEFASKSTRNGWKNASKRRLAALSGKQYTAPAPVEVEVDEPKKRVHKKKKV